MQLNWLYLIGSPEYKKLLSGIIQLQQVAEDCCLFDCICICLCVFYFFSMFIFGSTHDTYRSMELYLHLCLFSMIIILDIWNLFLNPYSSHLKRLSTLDSSWVVSAGYNGLAAHNSPSWLGLYLSVCKLLDLSLALPAQHLPQFQMYQWAFVSEGNENNNVADASVSSAAGTNGMQFYQVCIIWWWLYFWQIW